MITVGHHGVPARIQGAVVNRGNERLLTPLQPAHSCHAPTRRYQGRPEQWGAPPPPRNGDSLSIKVETADTNSSVGGKQFSPEVERHSRNRRVHST